MSRTRARTRTLPARTTRCRLTSPQMAAPVRGWMDIHSKRCASPAAARRDWSMRPLGRVRLRPVPDDGGGVGAQLVERGVAHLARAAVGVHHHPRRGVGDEDGVVGVLEDGAVALLGGPQRLLGRPLVGDVLVHRHHLQHLAVRAADGEVRRLHPARPLQPRGRNDAPACTRAGRKSTAGRTTVSPAKARRTRAPISGILHVAQGVELRHLLQGEPPQPLVRRVHAHHAAVAARTP